MDSRTKVFRAHRAIAWLYAILGVGISAAVFLGSGGGMDVTVFLVPLIFAIVFSAHYFTAEHARKVSREVELHQSQLPVLCSSGSPSGLS